LAKHPFGRRSVLDDDDQPRVVPVGIGIDDRAVCCRSDLRPRRALAVAPLEVLPGVIYVDFVGIRNDDREVAACSHVHACKPVDAQLLERICQVRGRGLPLMPLRRS